MKKAISDKALMKLALALPDYEPVGFQETMELYQRGTKDQIKAFEQFLDNEDWESAWGMLKEVINKDLPNL